jgi:predicted nucleic acid-binding protein
MKKILFDSDVLIEHLRANQIVTDQLQGLLAENCFFAYSVISDAEIVYGARESEFKLIDQFLSLFDCVEISKQISRQAGVYLKKYAKSHALMLPDALIAATAKVKGLMLCTFNKKHFPMKDIEYLRLTR